MAYKKNTTDKQQTWILKHSALKWNSHLYLSGFGNKMRVVRFKYDATLQVSL